MNQLADRLRYLPLSYIKDHFIPAAPGTLSRTTTINEIGLHRVSRRKCILKSIMIICPGAFARIKLRNGKQRDLVEIPSPFTGSFQYDIEMEAGIEVLIQALSTPNIAINWAEQDTEIV